MPIVFGWNFNGTDHRPMMERRNIPEFLFGEDGEAGRGNTLTIRPIDPTTGKRVTLRATYACQGIAIGADAARSMMGRASNGIRKAKAVKFPGEIYGIYIG